MTELTIQAFRDWLAARQDAFVGCGGNPFSCPIACWLSETSGVECWVSRECYGVKADYRGVPNPAWVRWFVDAFDRLYEYDEGVSGAVALALLSGLPAPAGVVP